MADLTELRTRWLAYGQALHDEAIDLMVAELKLAAPVGEDRMEGGSFTTPGETQRRIEAVAGGTLTRPSSTVIAPTKQGEYVEEGTPPHIIRPKNPDGVLAWRSDRGVISQPSPNSRIATRTGGMAFAKWVEHPGQPARPWFRPVVERYAEFLERAALRVSA